MLGRRHRRGEGLEVTRAKPDKATVRQVVGDSHGDLVAEVYDRILVLRPKGCRRGGPAEVTWTCGSLAC